MEQKDLIGNVQTVLGMIDANSMGTTLPHEHLLIDSSFKFKEPIETEQKKFAYAPLTLETLSWIKTHLTNNLEDLKMSDEEIAVKEALEFKREGGQTIVELTNIGICRNPAGLCRIAHATGLNIVMGSGYYIGASHPPALAEKSPDEIAKEIIRDITVGVGSTGIRAGIIGEIGCSTPLTVTEKKSLVASAIAQRKTGAAINVHPGSGDAEILNVVEILNKAGADLRHTIISHVVKRGFSFDTLRTIASVGCYLEIDNFGHDHMNAMPYMRAENRRILNPSDIELIDTVIRLIEEGYMNQILISSDCCFKQNLITFGGHGYAHLLRNIIPWMKAKGVSNEQIYNLTVENPKRALPFFPPGHALSKNTGE